MVNIACERELCSFIFVDPVVRLTPPLSSADNIYSGVDVSSSINPGMDITPSLSYATTKRLFYLELSNKSIKFSLYISK